MDGPIPADPANLDTLVVLLFALTFVSIFGILTILVLMSITAKPLREYIYEEIFYSIGANFNSVEAHSAKTAFFATNKVDLITHLLYLNTLTFLCVDFTKQNKVDGLAYWIVLGVLGAAVLGNNLHGYRIMNTTASTCNTKLYFIVRWILQCLYIYLSLTLVLNKSLGWADLELTDAKTEVRTLQIICAVVCLFSCIVFGGLLWTASALLKVKSRTEFD